MNSPDPKHATDEQILHLSDGDPAKAFERKGDPADLRLWREPPKARPEHPLTARLYRDFRAGSNRMTKDEAYNIGDELDAQLARIVELEAEVTALKRAGAELVRQVMAGRESFS